MRAQEISAPHAFHAEGPCWDVDWGGLKYVDMLAGDVLSPRPDGGVDRVHVGKVAAALRPRGSGGAIIATERGFALATAPDLSDVQQMQPLWNDPGIRFNDGGCDPMGNFYCGTMAYDQTPGAASLYLLTSGGLASQVLTGLTVSNGIGWTGLGDTGFHNDTPTRIVWTFDWSPDGIADRRPFVTLPDDVAGDPDGLCVDEQGGVWVALYGGSAVHRYSPEGELDHVVDLPVTNVTACTFGGDGLRTLYITTTRENVPDGEQPLAGAVFACEPGIGGLPARPFAG
ncbi:SMP-30/gluconolactonase/LRE family protein [Allobranchiibius sp. GilTou73]|uniref:SMP-30/gluconolactonase/LRE family protein n=1 Tax=Allobranchiibius sp. GilTou73 TaxID=2904523 RepID=UPI001F452D8A|nr:SMP-30/gluconolactonase/LRE family protein [Allobranchiibius sp. GilTou73]UIJ35178.1 SMP-30/gluconolactonase/LRE family protein [Allobranchiibius sp. GilTou73]